MRRALAILGASLLVACGGNAHRDAQIGAREHPRIIAQYGGAYKDEKANAYVKRVMQKVATASDQPDIDYRITILDTPIVNAIALPGGYTYVTRGLLALANNEAELAGVIGHEIAHITARHSASRHTAAVSGAILTTIVLAALDVDPNLAELGIHMGAHATAATYGRKQEHEADMLGVELLKRADYQPRAVPDFLASMGRYTEIEARLEGRAVREDTGWFDTHPNTQDRIARALEAVRNVGGSRNAIIGREAHLAAIDGLPYGDNPNQGIYKNGRVIFPRFNMAVRVPTGFKLRNTENGFVMRRPQHPDIIAMQIVQPTPQKSTRAILREGFSVFASNQNVQITSESRVAIEGRDALEMHARLGTNALVGVLVPFRNGQYYRFMSSAPQATSAATQSARLRTAIDFVSPAELGRARPKYIRLITVKPKDTPRKLARKMKVDRYKYELFVALNGLKTRRLTPGTRLKIIDD